MTSDFIKNALIDYLSGQVNIPVVDSESTDDLELPCVAVKITQSQRVSLALSKVESINIEVTYREHQGDENRETMEDYSSVINDLLIEPGAIKAAINAAIDDGVVVDFLQFSGGAPSWDEATFQCTFEGECYAQRGTIA
jgi:hypothetical protein